jgi:hypothetical protein
MDEDILVYLTTPCTVMLCHDNVGYVRAMPYINSLCIANEA